MTKKLGICHCAVKRNEKNTSPHTQGQRSVQVFLHVLTLLFIVISLNRTRSSPIAPRRRSNPRGAGAMREAIQCPMRAIPTAALQCVGCPKRLQRGGGEFKRRWWRYAGARRSAPPAMPHLGVRGYAPPSRAPSMAPVGSAPRAPTSCGGLRKRSPSPAHHPGLGSHPTTA